MSDKQDLNAIFDRITNRNATDGDIQTLRQSVVIAGNAQGATIVTGNDNILGDNNTVQIGKYNINIAEGSNIKVGDTIYQGAGAEMIRAMLLEVLTDKIVIDSTFLRLFGKSESSGVDWDWGMKLLKQKQLPEIRKRLTDTLGRDRILMDVSIEEQQNWVNRSPLAADRTLQINGEDCGRLDANKMLIETFGRDDIEGKLLILGAPGAGKTTALLSLAEQLVYGAISQPRTVIPVIFELSTWQNDNQSIQSWLIEQLYDLHGGNRKSKLYEQWLERQVLLPLLDGLDELGLERQKKCTEKLNEFAEHYPQLVVCCRVKEFEAVDIKLRNLRGAVCLQSLSDSQIQHYLDSLKRPELWEAIQTTSSLQAMLEPTIEGDAGLLRVPLFVKLVADVYDPQQPISSKADLLDKYIDRQLSFDKREIEHRKELNEYKWAYKTVKLEPDWNKTRRNLIWLARNLQANNKVEFLIEHLQPSWLNSVISQNYYTLFFGLFFGLFFTTPSCLWIDSITNISIVRMLLVKLSINTLTFGAIFLAIGKSNNGLENGLIGGLFYGISCELQSLIFAMNPNQDIKVYNILILFLNDGKNSRIAMGILFALTNGVVFGAITGLINGTVKIEPIESFQFSMSNAVRNLNVVLIEKLLIVTTKLLLLWTAFMLLLWLVSVVSINLVRIPLSQPVSTVIMTVFQIILILVAILVFVMIIILIDWIFRGLIKGLKQELKVRLRPNQGIWNSLQSQVLITIIIFVPVIAISISFHSMQDWRAKLGISLVLGFAVGGGKACLQHLSLRIVLWQSGLPWNFARFLNYCVERRLLLRVGGSYRFLHRELLDHFAQSNHLD
jgi:Effector-associated domain 10/NACHT domain